MKGLNLPVFLLTLNLLGGILLAPYLPFNLITLQILLVICFLAVLGIRFWSKTQHLVTTFPFYLNFFLLGLTLVQLHNPSNIETHFIGISHFGTQNPVTLQIREVLKEGRYADRYFAEIIAMDGVPASGKVLLYISRDSSHNLQNTLTLPAVDERFYLNAKINPVPAPKNPHQFNYADYLAKKGIVGQISINPKSLFLLDSSIRTAQGRAAHVRSFLQQKLAVYDFDPLQWGVINALLLGQRQELTEEVSATYRDAGVIHILAVSGLHVGMVLFLLQFALQPLGSTKRMIWLRSVLVIVGIWGFAFLTGLSPSILRAATMFSFLQIGLASRRKNGGMNGLIASAFVLMIFDPNVIYQVGFQLSYLAVFFILWLQPMLSALWRPRFKAARYFWNIMTVSLAAQLGVLPLSLFYFHQFPGLFLVANLVVLPFLGMILGFGLFMLLLASINLLPDFYTEAYGQIITLLNTFIAWIAHFDAMIVKHIYFSGLLMLLSYLLLITGISMIRKFNYRRIMLFLTTICIAVLSLVGEKFSGKPDAFYILYKSRESLLVHHFAKTLTLHTTDGLPVNPEHPLVTSFTENAAITTYNTQKLQNIYVFKSQKILIVDSLGIYKIPELQPDYIILTQSPKINLNRLIKTFPKTHLIADGSNYISYVARWKETCEGLGIPFHYTYEKGYFKID